MNSAVRDYARSLEARGWVIVRRTKRHVIVRRGTDTVVISGSPSNDGWKVRTDAIVRRIERRQSAGGAL